MAFDDELYWVETVSKLRVFVDAYPLLLELINWNIDLPLQAVVWGLGFSEDGIRIMIVGVPGLPVSTLSASIRCRTICTPALRFL